MPTKTIKNKIKLFHIRHPKEKAVITAAARVGENETYVTFGFAFCSPNDNFSKKVGRTKAIGRLNTKNAIIEKFNGHSADILCNVWNSGECPKPQIWKHVKLVSSKENGTTAILEA